MLTYPLKPSKGTSYGLWHSGWLRSPVYTVLRLCCVAFIWFLTDKAFWAPTLLHGADGLQVLLPGQHTWLFRNYPCTYLQRYWVVIYSV